MKATVEQIKQWLDMQIGMNIVQHQSLVLTEKKDIFDDVMVPDVVLKNISATDHIHINDESLRVVVEALDLPVEVIDRETDPSYRYELRFVYNGVTFLSIESETEYRERGELA